MSRESRVTEKKAAASVAAQNSQLRGYGWLRGVRQAYNLDDDQLRVFVERGKARTGTSRKWLARKAIPKRHSAAQLDRQLPGSLLLFESPFFDVLANRCYGKRARRQAIRACVNICQRAGWDVSAEPGGRGEVLAHWHFDVVLRLGVIGLRERESLDTAESIIDNWCVILDICAMTLGWARAVADAERAPLEHSKAFRKFLDWVPWLLSLDFWGDDLKAIIRDRISDLMVENVYTAFTTKLDWEVIDRRITQQDLDPIREHRPRDPIDGRFVLPESAAEFGFTCEKCGCRVAA